MIATTTNSSIRVNAECRMKSNFFMRALGQNPLPPPWPDSSDPSARTIASSDSSGFETSGTTERFRVRWPRCARGCPRATVRKQIPNLPTADRGYRLRAKVVAPGRPKREDNLVLHDKPPDKIEAVQRRLDEGTPADAHRGIHHLPPDVPKFGTPLASGTHIHGKYRVVMFSMIYLFVAEPLRGASCDFL